MIQGCIEDDIIEFKTGLIGRLAYINDSMNIIFKDFFVEVANLKIFNTEIECIRRPEIAFDLCPDNFRNAPIVKISPKRYYKFSETERMILLKAYGEGYSFIKNEDKKITLAYEDMIKGEEKIFDLMSYSTFANIKDLGFLNIEVLLYGIKDV